MNKTSRKTRNGGRLTSKVTTEAFVESDKSNNIKNSSHQTDIKKFFVPSNIKDLKPSSTNIPDPLYVPAPDEASLPCSNLTLDTDIKLQVNCYEKFKEKDCVKPKRDKKNKKKTTNLNSESKLQNSQLTDFFPVRRSNRKTYLNVMKEKQKLIETAILSADEKGFEVKEFPEKGRGVITTKFFKKGEFVLEYDGDFIDYSEAKKREELYSAKENTGCYMYYFQYMNKTYCIDATKESGRLGRLINHSKKGNLKTEPVLVQKRPHLVLFASRDIDPGEELLYDYGDRSKKSLISHPWLAL
ncbi:N-lysine methyltransferase KMT5A-like [Uloborus diversus]|uniref:N-lysine methyltransferase KMT5A-like n=1 Tax=Uloborus diversus TaxID=327109 RepID=UPI002408F26B|nr:N-lysine methyltransferase KMT5A-like [Uloborus diversus]